MAAGDEAKDPKEEGGCGDAPVASSKGSRSELLWDIPMSVSLPIEVQRDLDPAHQPFPFLDTTLADLGIQE